MRWTLDRLWSFFVRFSAVSIVLISIVAVLEEGPVEGVSVRLDTHVGRRRVETVNSNLAAVKLRLWVFDLQLWRLLSSVKVW